MELARRAFVLWIVAALPSLAQQAIERGEYDRAVNCLDAYLAFNSDDARIHLMLGWANFKKGAQAQAIDAYSDAIRLDPERAAAFVGRGTSHGAAGQLDRAIADLTTALQLDPNAVDAYYNRGLAYSQKGQLDKALADFDQVVCRLPENTEALRQRALLYCEMQKHGHAVADYEVVLRLEPENVSARLSLVDLLASCPDADVRNLARADALADRLNPHATSSYRAYAMLAATQARRGDMERAIAWQRKALACADHLDKEERRRTALLLKLYRTRKKQADKESSRKATKIGPPQQGGGQ